MNPFKAPQIHFSGLFYGPPEAGKTRAALTFPRCAVIDTEGGAAYYATVPGIEKFDVLRTGSLQQVHSALDYLRADGGRTYSTVVLDSMTTIWTAVKRQFADDKGALTYNGRSGLNLLMAELFNKLTDLPMHVVATAHQGVEYEAEGKNLKKVGDRIEADARVTFPFAVVVRMLNDHSGVIEKRWGEGLTAAKLAEVSWTTLQPLIQDARVAAEFRDPERVKVWIARWDKQGVTSKDLAAALGVKKWSEWTGGEALADEKVRAHIGLATQPSGADESEDRTDEELQAELEAEQEYLAAMSAEAEAEAGEHE